MGVITADSYGKKEEKGEIKRPREEVIGKLPPGYEIKFGFIVPISIMRRFTSHAISDTPIPIFREVMSRRGEDSWRGASGYFFSKSNGLEDTFGEIREKTITRLANGDISLAVTLNDMTRERLGKKPVSPIDVIEWVRTWQCDDVIDMIWAWNEGKPPEECIE